MLALRTIAAATLAVAACTAGGEAYIDPGQDASLTIVNDSDYILEEVRIAPVDSRSWGPNMTPDALFPGENLTVTVDCDYYDVLVVDETGVDCVLADIDLCFSDDTWVITNATLDACAFAY